MRRPIDAAEPVRYVLLGMLVDGPRHGYDLARAFVPGTAIGSIVHLATSHMYALLSHMEREGLIEGEYQEQGLRPTRRVYRITETGSAAFSRWIDTPVARPRDVSLEFQLKLYLTQRLDRERALTLVGHQREHFAAYLADLEREPQQDSPPTDRAFLRLLREARIERTRSTLTWLDLCAQTLAAQSPGAR